MKAAAAPKTPNIHKALRLPSGYRAHISMTGHVKVGESHHHTRLVELRAMKTDTLGQNMVWAMHAIHAGSGWREITGEQFGTLTSSVLSGQQLSAEDRESLGL
jgi:hypothetical protein